MNYRLAADGRIEDTMAYNGIQCRYAKCNDKWRMYRLWRDDRVSIQDRSR